MTKSLNIREVLRDEYELLGQLMVEVYSNLEGFPTQDEQPDYYEMLANIGSFTEQKDTKVRAHERQSARRSLPVSQLHATTARAERWP